MNPEPKPCEMKPLEDLCRINERAFYIYGGGQTAVHLRSKFAAHKADHEDEAGGMEIDRGLRGIIESDEALLALPDSSTVVFASSFYREIYERVGDRIREKNFDLWYYPAPDFELSVPAEAYCIVPFVQSTISQNGNACLCCVSEQHVLRDEQGKPMNIREYSLEQIWHSAELNAIRQKMLSGKRVVNCTGCYVAERKYGISYRTNMNRVLGRFATRVPLEKPKSMDLRIENLCNLRCVICSPQWSSGVENDPVHKSWFTNPDIVRIPNRFDNRKQWQSDTRLIDEISRFGSEVEHLLLAGGDPFISSAMMGFVDSLIASNKAGGVELTIFTNFTRFTRSIGEKLSRFKKINLTLSIDAHGEIYEFVRYPAKWRTIEENLALLETIPGLRGKAEVGVNISLSMFGAPFCEDIIQWCERNSLGWYLGLVFGPAHVSPRFLPQKIKAEVRARLSSYDKVRTDSFLKMMEETDSSSEESLKVQADFVRFAEEIARSRKLSLNPFHALIDEINSGIGKLQIGA